MAQERRRTDEATSVGISVPDLKDTLLAQFPEVSAKFPKLNNTTVRRMGLPPNKASISSKSYHGTVPFKAFRIENSEHHFSEQSHESFSQVALICEELFYFKSLGDDIHVVSLDNVSKFRIGDCTLTSRYHQPSRMNLSAPLVPSHDFYDTSITCSAYLTLTPSDQKYNYDSKQRKRVTIPCNGPLNVFISADKYQKQSTNLHLEHLSRLLPEKTAVLGLMLDKGPDNNFENETSFMEYGRFWKSRYSFH
jgi:hypothetical protein